MAFWGTIALKIKAWALMIGAVLAAVFGVYFYGRHSGSLKEMQKAAERDQKNARRVEDAADKARDTNIDDPIERLRKSKRVRD